MTRIFEGKSVEHDYFLLPPEVQGGSIAKTILRNSLDIYDSMGLDRITLHANINVGGYAWSRYGFKPKSKGWWRAFVDSSLNEKWLNLRESIAGQGADSVVKEVDRLMKSKDPRAIRQVAALKHATPGGQPLGKALLLDTDWFGELDLNDPEDYGIFSAYLNQ